MYAELTGTELLEFRVYAEIVGWFTGSIEIGTPGNVEFEDKDSEIDPRAETESENYIVKPSIPEGVEIAVIIPGCSYIGVDTAPELIESQRKRE